jgi:hypothetical protein
MMITSEEITPALSVAEFFGDHFTRLNTKAVTNLLGKIRM